jgi:hypothetical protein
VIVRLGQKNYLDAIETAISTGDTVLIENIDEIIDPVLDPVIGRHTIKKGRAVRLGDREVEYNPKFRLILHTKLANPHYKVSNHLSLNWNHTRFKSKEPFSRFSEIGDQVATFLLITRQAETCIKFFFELVYSRQLLWFLVSCSAHSASEEEHCYVFRAH